MVQSRTSQLPRQFALLVGIAVRLTLIQLLLQAQALAQAGHVRRVETCTSGARCASAKMQYLADSIDIDLLVEPGGFRRELTQAAQWRDEADARGSEPEIEAQAVLRDVTFDDIEAIECLGLRFQNRPPYSFLRRSLRIASRQRMHAHP